MDLNHLQIFHRVVRHGSLAAAARALGVPTSTVSRQVSRLEADLGTDLLRRTSRGVALTEAGAELLERSAGPLSDLRDLARALPAGRLQGTLRLTVPSNLANLPWFAELLLDFQLAHPDVVLDVDLSARVLNLAEEGFDVGFRPAATVPDSPDLILRALPPLDVRLFASPSYLARRGRPSEVSGLGEHDFVTVRHLVAQPLVLRREDEVVSVDCRAAMIGDDLSFVLAMVGAGAGIAPIPRPYVEQRGDAFVELLPQWTLPAFQPAIAWPRRRFAVPRVKAFVDFAVDRFAARLGRPR